MRRVWAPEKETVTDKDAKCEQDQDQETSYLDNFNVREFGVALERSLQSLACALRRGAGWRLYGLKEEFALALQDDDADDERPKQTGSTSESDSGMWQQQLPRPPYMRSSKRRALWLDFLATSVGKSPKAKHNLSSVLAARRAVISQEKKQNGVGDIATASAADQRTIKTPEASPADQRAERDAHAERIEKIYNANGSKSISMNAPTLAAGTSLSREAAAQQQAL